MYDTVGRLSLMLASPLAEQRHLNLDWARWMPLIRGGIVSRPDSNKRMTGQHTQRHWWRRSVHYKENLSAAAGIRGCLEAKHAWCCALTQTEPSQDGWSIFSSELASRQENSSAAFTSMASLSLAASLGLDRQRGRCCRERRNPVMRNRVHHHH